MKKHADVRVETGMVKIAVYTDGILIPFLFHILRFQVSGVRNDEQRRWHLKPGIREGINMGYFLKPYYGQF
ncbi:MAG: hypothetical protein JRF62_02495 [Deltaproteobacteria bacterium]|nr:hypothetical protein [Deltaproteobacteria bacterium]MBW2597880.1 hypothetical protein [Deltaproteobacteria bacterium]MBW2639483.1 hypothetical protein [Deltaproteobacteria bacterium]